MLRSIWVIFLFITLSFVVYAYKSPEELWCVQKKEQYNIEPGKSFGTLPLGQHKMYLDAKCYRFFCKPHPKAGKGVFDCEPLNEKEKLNHNSTDTSRNITT